MDFLNHLGSMIIMASLVLLSVTMMENDLRDIGGILNIVGLLIFSIIYIVSAVMQYQSLAIIFLGNFFVPLEIAKFMIRRRRRDCPISFVIAIFYVCGTRVCEFMKYLLFNIVLVYIFAYAPYLGLAAIDSLIKK